jgi:hypothetical protein
LPRPIGVPSAMMAGGAAKPRRILATAAAPPSNVMNSRRFIR